MRIKELEYKRILYAPLRRLVVQHTDHTLCEYVGEGREHYKQVKYNVHSLRESNYINKEL
jgi:hypothetical protein